MQKPSSHLSWLNKFLTLWILLAMVAEVGTGYIFQQKTDSPGEQKIGDSGLGILNKELNLDKLHYIQFKVIAS